MAVWMFVYMLGIHLNESQKKILIAVYIHLALYIIYTKKDSTLLLGFTISVCESIYIYTKYVYYNLSYNKHGAQEHYPIPGELVWN